MNDLNRHLWSPHLFRFFRTFKHIFAPSFTLLRLQTSCLLQLLDHLSLLRQLRLQLLQLQQQRLRLRRGGRLGEEGQAKGDPHGGRAMRWGCQAWVPVAEAWSYGVKMSWRSENVRNIWSCLNYVWTFQTSLMLVLPLHRTGCTFLPPRKAGAAHQCQAEPSKTNAAQQHLLNIVIIGCHEPRGSGMIWLSDISQWFQMPSIAHKIWKSSGRIKFEAQWRGHEKTTYRIWGWAFCHDHSSTNAERWNGSVMCCGKFEWRLTTSVPVPEVEVPVNRKWLVIAALPKLCVTMHQLGSHPSRNWNEACLKLAWPADMSHEG